jgi:hypothetical protein
MDQLPVLITLLILAVLGVLGVVAHAVGYDLHRRAGEWRRQPHTYLAPTRDYPVWQAPVPRPGASAPGRFRLVQDGEPEEPRGFTLVASAPGRERLCLRCGRWRPVGAHCPWCASGKEAA